MSKHCEACEKEIADSDKKCPACGVDFEELEADVTAYNRAATIAEKRKKKAAPPEPETKPEEKKKRSFLRSLGGRS